VAGVLHADGVIIAFRQYGAVRATFTCAQRSKGRRDALKTGISGCLAVFGGVARRTESSVTEHTQTRVRVAYELIYTVQIRVARLPNLASITFCTLQHLQVHPIPVMTMGAQAWCTGRRMGFHLQPYPIAGSRTKSRWTSTPRSLQRGRSGCRAGICLGRQAWARASVDFGQQLAL